MRSAITEYLKANPRLCGGRKVDHATLHALRSLDVSPKIGARFASPITSCRPLVLATMIAAALAVGSPALAKVLLISERAHAAPAEMRGRAWLVVHKLPSTTKPFGSCLKATVVHRPVSGCSWCDRGLAACGRHADLRPTTPASHPLKESNAMDTDHKSSYMTSGQ